ncbi:hypothetical protein K440DRAFT_630184 [Wilcoxina mikolae CBS 423.85]|nr:hypothetical protein K440DRAFT_630184 [Wilcoxina mikolae CBS 423.85]
MAQVHSCGISVQFLIICGSSTWQPASPGWSSNGTEGDEQLITYNHLPLPPPNIPKTTTPGALEAAIAPSAPKRRALTARSATTSTILFEAKCLATLER